MENLDCHYMFTFFGWDMLENTSRPIGIFWIENVRKQLVAIFWIGNVRKRLAATKHFQDWKW
jgi:hypothetical protein